MGVRLTGVGVTPAWLRMAAAATPPIFDMHLDAHTVAEYGGGASVCMNDEPMELPGAAR